MLDIHIEDRGTCPLVSAQLVTLKGFKDSLALACTKCLDTRGDIYVLAQVSLD